MLAQTVTDTDAVATFNAWWLVIASVLPFIYPFFVKAGAGRYFKFVISFLMSIVVATVTVLFAVDWNAITFETLLATGMAFVGTVQTIYQASKFATERLVLHPELSLNDLPIFRPSRGLGRDES